MDKVEIGRTLRELRGNLRTKEVASRAGVTVSAWNMYEHGKRVPRDPVKVRIAKMFGKSVASIFYNGSTRNVDNGESMSGKVKTNAF
ncbi:helix-turn-helix transcriptional regulator [Acidaminococcus timonensis]|uniref:helix-turn-helix transcriptional regulator n=1 Tax=Acidaminococcus timonensis TaxID=1871002 RepID=UPI00307A9D11